MNDLTKKQIIGYAKKHNIDIKFDIYINKDERLGDLCLFDDSGDYIFDLHRDGGWDRDDNTCCELTDDELTERIIENDYDTCSLAEYLEDDFEDDDIVKFVNDISDFKNLFYGVLISCDNGNVEIIYGIGETEKQAIDSVDLDKNWQNENDYSIIEMTGKAYEFIKKYGDLEGSNFNELELNKNSIYDYRGAERKEQA